MDPADASPLEALEAELRASQAECRALKRTADELRVQHFEAFADLNAQLEKAHAELDRTRQLLVIECEWHCSRSVCGRYPAAVSQATAVAATG